MEVYRSVLPSQMWLEFINMASLAKVRGLTIFLDVKSNHLRFLGCSHKQKASGPKLGSQKMDECIHVLSS